jgi:hypothetical protein
VISLRNAETVSGETKIVCVGKERSNIRRQEAVFSEPSGWGGVRKAALVQKGSFPEN